MASTFKRTIGVKRTLRLVVNQCRTCPDCPDDFVLEVTERGGDPQFIYLGTEFDLKSSGALRTLEGATFKEK